MPSNQKLQEENERLNDIVDKTKALFLNIAHQKEKVSSNLTVLIPLMYPQFDTAMHYEIKQKLLREMGLT